ncbi:hypothetical protein POTOM_019160 [Populus tomentosa]|uniref:SKP1-like protein n=1 Tax=Populus tomentosa TaxID=118781 RepID=A0A8X8CTY8_POPTO|nr:hypothetical protein POTOM_019160 [Populus tomentosa]
MSSGRKISLRSSDGESFEVDEAVALESQTIKHMIEDDCADNGIPLPNVTSKILAKVIEYCKKHVETPKSEDRGTNSGDDELKNWDTEFVRVDQATLFDLILDDDELLHSIAVTAVLIYSIGLLGLNSVSDAIGWERERHKQLYLVYWNKYCTAVESDSNAANYLNIKGLLDLTCQTVADMIKGKTPEEIRKTFNIKNDFTPEEEEEVRRENQWAFE